MANWSSYFWVMRAKSIVTKRLIAVMTQNLYIFLLSDFYLATARIFVLLLLSLLYATFLCHFYGQKIKIRKSLCRSKRTFPRTYLLLALVFFDFVYYRN